MIVKDFREKFYEIIDGESVLFPSDTLEENLATGKLLISLHDYVSRNKLGFIFMHLVFKLPDGNIVIPDLIFIGSDKEKLIETSPDDMFQGVPDMIAEISSPKTMKRDMTIKKDIYERNGVREYWIIDPYMKAISVYLLRDGKYFLDEIYKLFDEQELKLLDDDEKAELKSEVPVSILDGLAIPIEFVFSWGY